MLVASAADAVPYSSYDFGSYSATGVSESSRTKLNVSIYQLNDNTGIWNGRQSHCRHIQRLLSILFNGEGQSSSEAGGGLTCSRAGVSLDVKSISDLG